MTKYEAFSRIFQLPVAMRPYQKLIVTEQEIDLVIGLEEQPLTAAQVTEMLRISQDEADHLLREAWKRDIIRRVSAGDQVRYAPSQFYASLDYFSAYETGTWRKLPGTVRSEVAEWQLQRFIEMWKPAIEEAVRDPGARVRIKNRDVLLLEEALALVEASEHVCLLPCQCKTTLCPESPWIEGSMRLGERAWLTLEQGQGRSLTVAQAKAHLLHLDRMGLIHTGPREWREHDPELEWISHGNCNPSYSFPFLAGQRLGLDKVYPRAHYLAAIDWDRCTHCGACIGRCPFGAFYQDGTEVRVHGETRRRLIHDDDRCWGCGLCARSCPEMAIEMRPLS